jgi:tripartite-type tricarboxylate transporter receptor subunit TctC
MTDLIGGRITAMIITSAAVMPYVKDGRVRALAVTASTRSPALPGVPTVGELGMSQLQQLDWFGIFAPANTPRDIVTTINVAIAKVLAMPDVRARMAEQYVDPVGDTPEHFGAFHREELKRWTTIIEQSGVTVDHES